MDALRFTGHRQHGLDAPIFPAMRADKLLERSNIDGAQSWQLIVRRINDLLAKPTGAPNYAGKPMTADEFDESLGTVCDADGSTNKQAPAC